MDKTETLFTTQELIQFQAMLKMHVMASATTPLGIAKTGLQMLVLGIVGFVEWEIIYQVFEYLSSENDYWSPEIMGLTAAIMIIGFHLLVYSAPHNFAVRFVNRAVQFLIPLYMVGVGLLIASILDVGSVIETDMVLMIGAVPDGAESNWFDGLFAKITDPLAVMAFSLGLGGLAIVNIFVAHHLIALITINLEDITGRLSRAKQALQDHGIILRTQKHYAALGNALGALDSSDDSYIRMQIASDVLSVMADALLPHKQWLMAREMNEPSPFGLQDTTDPKFITSRIKKIEAISSQDILKALTIPKLLETNQ